MSEQFTITNQVDALDFVGCSGGAEHGAVVGKQSSQVLVISSEVDFEERNGIAEPDGLDDNPRYINIPNVQALELGKPTRVKRR